MKDRPWEAFGPVIAWTSNGSLTFDSTQSLNLCQLPPNRLRFSLNIHTCNSHRLLQSPKWPWVDSYICNVEWSKEASGIQRPSWITSGHSGSSHHSVKLDIPWMIDSELWYSNGNCAADVGACHWPLQSLAINKGNCTVLIVQSKYRGAVYNYTQYWNINVKHITAVRKSEGLISSWLHWTHKPFDGYYLTQCGCVQEALLSYQILNKVLHGNCALRVVYLVYYCYENSKAVVPWPEA